MIVCLMLTMLPTSAFAAGENGIAASTAKVKAGETFVVTLKIPSISETLSNIEFNISFDNMVFDVTEYNQPSFATMSNTPAEANAAGKLTCTNVSPTGDNDITALQSGGTMTATFKAKDTAVAGSYSFTVSKYEIKSIDETTYMPIDHAPTGTVKVANVEVVSELAGNLPVTITAPAKDGTPETTITGTNYTGSITWSPTVAAGGKFAANTVYTAKVELTAKTGYQFANGVNPTVTDATISDTSVSPDGSTLSFKASFPKTADKNPLTGTVKITGTPKINEALTADTTALPTDVTGLTYKWYRVGTTESLITGETGNTYTPSTKDDVGKKIKVVVTAENYSGSQDATTTDAVAKAAYTGGTPSENPAVLSVTDTQVTAKPSTVLNCYGVTLATETTQPSSWMMSGIISGLNPNTKYKLWGCIVSDTVENSPATYVEFTTTKSPVDATTETTLRGSYTPYTGTYDGTAHNAFSSVATLPAGWASTYSRTEAGPYTAAIPQVTNVADSGKIYVKFANPSYADVIAEYDVTVSAKDISGAVITYGTQNTYNGSEQDVVVASVVLDGTTLTVGSNYALDGNTGKATNVEGKKLEIFGKGNYSGSATAATEWKLQQATPVVGDFVTSGLAASYSYNGSEQTAPDPTTDKTGMGAVTVNYPGSTTPKYVGDYNLQFSVAAGQNYTAAGPFLYGTMKIVAVEDPAVITTTASMPKGGYSLDLRTLVSDDAKGAVTFAIAPEATSATLSGYTLTSTGIPGTVNINVTIKAKDENGDSKVEYTGKTGTITVTVQNKTTDSSTMKVTQDGCTYGETLPDYVLSGKPTGAGTDTVLYTGTLRNGSTYSSSTAPTEAGSYTVKVECETATTIYKATSASFTIEPKSISGATVDAITGLTYTGTAHTPAPAVKMNGTALNNATDYTLSYSENTNAGTATMTVTGKGNYNDTKTVNFGIGQATLTITDATIGAKAYDGTKNATVTSVTFSGLQNSETLDMTTDYTVTGVFNSENVNDANTATVSVTLKDTAKTKNYTLPTATFNKPATITQATTPAAPTGLTGVKDQMLSTVSLAAHPGWSWANPSQSMNATGSQSFTANYTDPNGNYAPGTGISVVVEVSAKADVSGSITFPNGTLTYNGAGQKYEKATTSTTAAGTPVWTYTYAVSGTGALDSAGLPKTAGTYTVTAKYEDDANIGTKNATLTINKATPTGEPKYTKITTSGKTLVDAGLTVTGSTLNPNAGTLKWVDDAGAVLPDTTTVAANTSYKWLYTPADTANYNTLTGSIELYHKSSSGGGGGSYSPSYSITVDKTENGTITVSPKSASKGDTVTITVKPDKGYELDTLKVLDKNSDKVKLTEKNGKYTFTMPTGKVTVKGSFVEEAPVQIFKDVPVDAYYYEAVKWAAEKGITGGVGNGLFAPNQPCTRAQIVTFLWRAAGSPAPKHMSSFTDVPADAFYAKAVAWAVENGITGGTGDGKFSPDATCTRAQSVTFLYRASGSPAVSGSAAFSDVAANAYYADAVKWAEKNGITGGIGGGLFGSGNDCTRAQIVTFLYRNYQSK